MSEAYSVYFPQPRWRHAACVGQRLAVLFGGPHTSEPSFRRATVQPGDLLYPIGVCDQVLYVLGRMRVQQIVSADEDRNLLQEYFARYSAGRFLAPTCTTEVVIGCEGTGVLLDRPLPASRIPSRQRPYGGNRERAGPAAGPPRTYLNLGQERAFRTTTAGSWQAYDSAMPASRIDEAVRRLSPEPLLCWCNGQSLESRYSSSVSPAGAAGGQAAGAAVLRYQLGRARLKDAVPMPRFPVIAVSTTRIYLFSGPLPGREAFAVLPRDQVRVMHGGNPMWRRLDLLTADDGVPRSYTMMVSGLSGARKRLQRLIGELESG